MIIAKYILNVWWPVDLSESKKKVKIKQYINTFWRLSGQQCDPLGQLWLSKFPPLERLVFADDRLRLLCVWQHYRNTSYKDRLEPRSGIEHSELLQLLPHLDFQYNSNITTFPLSYSCSNCPLFEISVQLSSVTEICVSEKNTNTDCNQRCIKYRYLVPVCTITYLKMKYRGIS